MCAVCCKDLTSRLLLLLLLLLAADLHGNFVRQFWRFQAKSKDIKGVRYIGLSKVAGEQRCWAMHAYAGCVFWGKGVCVSVHLLGVETGM